MGDGPHQQALEELASSPSSPDSLSAEKLPSMPSADGSDRVQVELERLLAMAEELQEKCDRISTRLEAANMAAAIVLVLSIGYAAFYLTAKGFGRDLILFGAISFCALMVMGSIQSSAKRRLARDRRALASIVGLLRETESGLLMQGRYFSTFELAQFRIRMSRFEIGP